MTPRRRLLVTASAALALGALTGCEKPAPIVTVVSGGQSVYKEANTFCFEGQSFVKSDCAVRDAGLASIEVTGGETVGVDVSKEVVERGWFIELVDPLAPADTAPQTSEVQDGHYFTFTAPNLAQNTSLELIVRTLSEGSADEVSGEWQFELRPK